MASEQLSFDLDFEILGDCGESLEKTLKLGKIEGRRRRGRQGMRWPDGITDSMNMNLSKLQRAMLQVPHSCCSDGGNTF